MKQKQAIDLTKCPRCGETAKVIPAGINKAGKAYEAFFACNAEESCKSNQNPEKNLAWKSAKQHYFLSKN